MAYTLASATIQDLKYEEKQDGLGVTITYASDGTAGAETVSVSSSRNITVHMQSGTSTATQIKTAVEANPEAAALVTVTVPGTAGTAQKSVVNATLASGAVAVKASKSVGGLTLTALTAGTAGNSTRFKFVTGALACSVASADITITFPVGTSASAIAAKINATSAAAALVKAEGGPSDTPRLAMASAFTNLAGGLAAVAASVIAQDLTYTHNLSTTAGNGTTISYTTGATAGSEVVSGSATAVSVQIENGVSTATQISTAVAASSLVAAVATCSGTITFGSPSNGSTVVITGLPTDGLKTFTKAASASGNNFAVIADLTTLINALTDLNATDNGTVITVTVATKGTAINSATITGTSSYSALSRTFSGGRDGVTCTVSGTGGTAQKTVNAQVTSGAIGAGTTEAFYTSQATTALTSSFVSQAINFSPRTLVIQNDETSGAKTVVGSFDGISTHFTLLPGENLTIDNPRRRALYLKHSGGAPSYRVTAL